MKRQRHEKIVEIIKAQPVETQEQLMELLKLEGFDVTQATVSRDIKELRLYKRADKSGNTRYDVEKGSALPDADHIERYRVAMKHNICNIDYAGNTVAIKCYVGMAQAVCAAIDGLNFDDIVGTIAGDDTIFILVRSEDAARKIIEDFKRIIQ